MLLFLLGIAAVCSCGKQRRQIMSTSHAFDSVVNVAERMHDSGFVSEAMHLVMDAHGRMTNLSVEDEVLYFNYCNIRYNKQKNYDKSIQMGDSMLLVLESSEDGQSVRSWRTVAYNIKADAMFAKGMYNDAYNYYYMAQKLAHENNDSCSKRSYSYSLAMTLYRQQRYMEAAFRFKEAYQLSSNCLEGFNLFYFKQELLDNIGLCYNAQHNYDSAMKYYHKALAYLDDNAGKFKDKQAKVFEAPKAVVYGNMAEVFRHQKKYDSAKILYENSIRINLQKGYANVDAIADQVKLSDLYYATGDVAKMKGTLDVIKAELDTLPDKHVELMWNKLMWQYCEHAHDSLRAFRHLRAYILQNEEYNVANKALMATDLDMRVSDIEKQYKIDLLTKDKNLAKLYLIILIVVAMMVFIIGLQIWMNYRKSQQNIVLLKNLNNTISTQKEQLEMALEELKVKENDKARILKSVAHDVMNPIAAIISLTDILLHEKDKFTESQLEIMNLIMEASRNSLSLSNDILEASREIESEIMMKEKTDINMLLAKSVELLNFRALAKKQQIIAKYPERRIYSYVHQDGLRRVLSNIIVNAIKYSHENTPIEIRLESTDEEVHISVKDSGVGIAEKNKAFVFDMFTDVRRRGTAGEMTHGLGLSISLQITKAHNGNIWFESEEGKGSTFHLVFPVGGEKIE